MARTLVRPEVTPLGSGSARSCHSANGHYPPLATPFEFDRLGCQNYAAGPPGRPFGKSTGNSAFIYAGASSISHMCEL